MAWCYLLAMDIAGYHAFNRFGLGRSPAEAVPANPKNWLREQLHAPDPANFPGLPRTDEALALVWEQRQERQAQKQAEPAPQAGQMQPEKPHPVGQLQQREVQALLANALMTPAGFRERLVWFWANHFSVSSRGLVPAACAGAYVREAIRPHVTGRFADMLLAVMRHPAMLAYLDQAESVGPESGVGLRKHRGLNENLARESLELHTVTPASGYTQGDVTNYAKLLTGWSIEIKEEPRGFRYRPGIHEPGPIKIFGQDWPQGEAGGVAMLDFLGTHPATYRHIAQKLVRHFVADTPPAADVRTIEAVLHTTRGNLGAASAVLIDLPGAWVAGTKLRTPQEYVIACLRALGTTPDQVPHLGGICGGLGQGVFQAPFPIGWPDRASDWAGPEAMLQRVDFAYGIAARNAVLDPEEVGETTLGPLLSKDTRDQIRGAGSRRDGMTLLLGSPEFARR
jgi:uncharacterized protein (DUF1800 family)